MIRNLQKKDTMQDITRNIMEMVSRVIKIQNTSNIYLIAFFNFLSFFCIVSILFLANPLEPPEANQIFKFFVLSHVGQLAKVDSQIVLIVLLVIVLITNILFVMNCFKTQFSFALSLMGIVMPIAQVILVPISFNVIQHIVDLVNSNYSSVGQLILKVLFSLFGTLATLQSLLFVYFDIRPLRDMNIMWNYDNRILFYSNLINIARAIVIFFDHISVTLLTFSLIIQAHIYYAPSSYMYPKTALINKCRSLLIIFIHLSLILGEVFENKKLCFIFLSASCFGCILIYVLDFISVSQSCEQIPKCCFENSSQIYSFYIDYRQKNKNTNEELMRKISAHYLVCDEQNCIFKDIQESNSGRLSNEDLEQKISKFLKTFRYETPQSELLYELWKIQLNKTVSLSHSLRDFSLSHQFVVHYVLGVEDSTKKELTSTNNNASSESLNQKSKFYKQLNNVIDQFEKMTEVMSKSLPQLNQVIDVVIGIHCETQALTKLFEDMVKNKQVNYFCIQLYLKFFQCFLDESKLSNDILDRLKRFKILAQSDYIEQNPLPCFLVEAFNKNIEKVNAQGLKFLKAHRYEVKDKNFNNIVLPSFNLKQLYTYQTLNQKQDEIPVFFKIKTQKQTVMACRNIKMKRLQQNNKNYYEITVHKKNNGCNVIEILIDSNQNMIGSTRNSLQLPYRDGKIQNQTIQSVYMQHIKPLLKQISLAKIGRIQFGQRISISGLVMQKLCPHTDMRLITVNLIKKVVQTRNQKRISNIRLSKLYASQSKFSFYYKQGKQNKIMLQGSQCRRGNEQSGINDTLEIRSINEKVSLLLANLAIPSIVNYSGGIKVYRLYNNDLYNIDLQDRSRYEEQFSSIQAIQSSRTLKFNVNENVYIILLVLFALLITGCSIFLNVTVDNQLAFIEEEQGKLIKIQQFTLNFNRILASLRDVANGLFQHLGRDYEPVVMDSYDELQSIDSSDFFSQQNYIGIYDGEVYKGSLSELIEVSLAHVYEYIQVKDDAIIQLIHDFAILQLGPKLSLERELKKMSILNTSNSLSHYSLLFFIFIVCGSVLYFILFVLLSQKFKKNMDAYLQPLLITSQPQIKRIVLECQKFKNVIVSLFKNYEVDLQAISSRREKNSKRIRPKLTNFGFSSILVEFFLGGFVVVTLICLALAQYTSTVSQIKKVNKLFNEGEAVVEVYSGLCWVTNKIDHTGIIDYQKLNSLSKYLTLIQNYKSRYQFSSQLTTLVTKVFFSDSCQYLQEKKIISPGWCGDSLVGFTLQNPFKLSLDLYFRRINYFLVSNLTDSFASSGVYSDPFKQLFQYLAHEISDYTYEKIVEIRAQLLILAIMVSAMSFFLIVILVITIVYFRRKVTTINNGLVSFSGQNSSGQQKQQAKKQKEEVKQKDNETSSNIMIETGQIKDQIRQQ